MTRMPQLSGLALGLMLITATATFADGHAYKLWVDGLACPFCAYGIEKKISAVHGVEKVDIEIDSGLVTVTLAPGAKLDEVTARQAVAEAGFSLRKFEAPKLE